jgi:hypothetical protein
MSRSGANSGQTGGHRHHVLLRDTHVNEALTHGIPRGSSALNPGLSQEYEVSVTGIPDHGLTGDVSHSLFISLSAC